MVYTFYFIKLLQKKKKKKERKRNLNVESNRISRKLADSSSCFIPFSVERIEEGRSGEGKMNMDGIKCVRFEEKGGKI